MSKNPNLWDYLEQREEEIVRERAMLLHELQTLREARATLESKTREVISSPRSEKLTIKEMIRSVLERNPEGGTSDQIINWINVIHGNEIARTSLSPQLSRLKAEGEVSLNEENGIWRLSTHPHAFNIMPRPGITPRVDADEALRVVLHQKNRRSEQ